MMTQVQERPRQEGARNDEYPTLFTIPLRAAWFDEAEPPESLIVRGTD